MPDELMGGGIRSALIALEAGNGEGNGCRGWEGNARLEQLGEIVMGRLFEIREVWDVVSRHLGSLV